MLVQFPSTQNFCFQACLEDGQITVKRHHKNELLLVHLYSHDRITEDLNRFGIKNTIGISLVKPTLD